MNPPRRRRTNPQEQRCRCAECDALAEGIDLDPEACMQAVADDIRSVGWSVSAVLGDEIAPPWAYTIGLWLSHQGPELTMFGLPVEHMTIILNTIGERVANGAVIEAGVQLDGICPCSLAVRPVRSSWRLTTLFAVSDRYYGYVRPACLQVVWPDRRGRYPGDPGFQPRYEGRQPMLWMPREDHPPGVWTRIDQLCLPAGRRRYRRENKLPPGCCADYRRTARTAGRSDRPMMERIKPMSRGGLARRFPVLAIRDFRLLLAERLLAPASVGFSMVGVSFAVLRATGSATDLSYVLAAQIAPTLVFALIGGVAADRVPPQRVIIAANLLMALGEGTFGVLVLTGRPPLWAMIGLEALTGTGIAVFYPASQALLPYVVPRGMLQEASAISRLAMNTGQMSGAAAAGLLVAAAGPGWALVLCGIGMVGTVPMLLSIRGAPGRSAGAGESERAASGLFRELREGWSEFRSHTWLWVIVAQFCVVLMAWYGAFSVLGPVVAREHLGGPAAWGAITAADALGLIAGGVVSLRVTPRRPMLFVVLTGAAIAVSPLSLAMVLPLPAVCVASFGLGVFVEMMMVQWTVALARNIPPGKLARVSSYDVLGSVMAMPAGALIAGPLGTAIGISSAQYVAAAAIVVASALALIPRDVRTMRSGDPVLPSVPVEPAAEPEAAEVTAVV